MYIEYIPNFMSIVLWNSEAKLWKAGLMYTKERIALLSDRQNIIYLVYNFFYVVYILDSTSNPSYYLIIFQIGVDFIPIFKGYYGKIFYGHLFSGMWHKQRLDMEKRESFFHQQLLARAIQQLPCIWRPRAAFLLSDKVDMYVLLVSTIDNN